MAKIICIRRIEYHFDLMAFVYSDRSGGTGGGDMKRAFLSAVFAAGVMATGAANAAQQGLASYYKSGHQTANGERFNPHGLTAAHRTLPFGTLVQVTNIESGKSVVVRINDRGPFKPKRVIDLSLGAAKMIDLVRAGIAPVEVIPLFRL
jgi:rare lipoprotein A (peptidoglycan hydrolase)